MKDADQLLCKGLKHLSEIMHQKKHQQQQQMIKYVEFCGAVQVSFNDARTATLDRL